MVVISYSGREANGKIVYYGPGLGGKTTNLEFIYDSVPASSRGKMVSMKTQTDRTLFFDFLPLDLGELGGFKTRFLLYTVPGQVFYNATRKLVLRGADAIAFIADSERGKMEENRESLANLEENLADYDLSIEDIPWVIQYNKRDLSEIYTVEELNKELNPRNVPFFEAVATEGIGVFETFRGLSKLLLEKLSEEIGQRMVIGRHLGQKQEEEPAEATVPSEAESQGVGEIPTEVESIEVAASSAPSEEEVPVEKAEDESLVASGSMTEELEPVQEEKSLAPAEDQPTEEAPSDAEDWESSSEIGIEAQPTDRSEEDAEKTEPREPAIIHEEDKVGSFFSEDAQSPPLETEIRREEVILSESMDSQGEADGPEADKQEEESPAEKEQWPQEPSGESTHEDEKREEAQEEEPSFVGIIRRNNVGVFKRCERPERERSASVTGESVPAKQDQQFVIDVPIEMAQEEEEKEIILTLRLKLTRRSQKKERQSEEFLLDGISR